MQTIMCLYRNHQFNKTLARYLKVYKLHDQYNDDNNYKMFDTCF